MRWTILLLLALSACATTPTAPAGFQERLLATLPEGINTAVSFAFTPDGRDVAFVGQNDDGAWVFHGTWKSRRLDAI